MLLFHLHFCAFVLSDLNSVLTDNLLFEIQLEAASALIPLEFNNLD